MKDNAVADKFRDEGNAFFSQVNFYEALISYNKSLCHAESQSVQLGLAYSNRSVVYWKLNEFNKCLANIQLARDNSYPHEAKLKKREEICKDAMKTHQRDTKNDPWSYFKLSYPPNKKIPWLADCIELKTNEKYGRHIIANRELKPGDVIAIEDPIFPVVAKSAVFKRCTFCLKSNMLSLIPCNCSSAMFCNKDCLKSGRVRFHGALCENIDSSYEQLDEETASKFISVLRGLLESLHAAERPEILRDLMNSTKSTTIFDYDLSNQQDDPDIDFKYLSIINDLGVHFASSSFIENLKPLFSMISSDCVDSFLQPPQDPEYSMLVEYSTRLAMISREKSNMTVVMGNRIQAVGVAIFPIRSLYSHSCDANVLVFHVDNKMVHIVTKPTREGDQLFIKYGHEHDFYYEPDRVKRQDALMKRFNFKCTCLACLNEYSVMSLPRYDLTFLLPGEVFLSTIGDLMEELQKSFDYIKKNFKNYPSYEVAITEGNVKYLAAFIMQKSVWPFEMNN